MKRSTRSKPHTVVKVGNVTVKIYKRARETANGKSTREIFEIADGITDVRRLRELVNITDAQKG